MFLAIAIPCKYCSLYVYMKVRVLSHGTHYKEFQVLLTFMDCHLNMEPQVVWSPQTSATSSDLLDSSCTWTTEISRVFIFPFTTWLVIVWDIFLSHVASLWWHYLCMLSFVHAVYFRWSLLDCGTSSSHEGVYLRVQTWSIKMDIMIADNTPSKSCIWLYWT